MKEAWDQTMRAKAMTRSKSREEQHVSSLLFWLQYFQLNLLVFFFLFFFNLIFFFTTRNFIMPNRGDPAILIGS